MLSRDEVKFVTFTDFAGVFCLYQVPGCFFCVSGTSVALVHSKIFIGLNLRRIADKADTSWGANSNILLRVKFIFFN